MKWPKLRRWCERHRDSGALLPVGAVVLVLISLVFLVCAAGLWAADAARRVPWRDGAIALGQGAAVAAGIVAFALAVAIGFGLAIGGAP